MELKDCNGIIFSNDDNYSYKVRNKCAENGINLNYVNVSDDLLFYIVSNNNGIVFVDLNDKSNLSIINKYSTLDMIKNFTFVFLSNDDNIVCDLEAKWYLTNYNSLDELLPRLKYLIYSDICIGLSKVELLKCVVSMLEKYGFAPNHKGYTYIKESVIHAVENCKGIIKFSENIYPTIATMYKTCPRNVEKDISSAIKKAYERNPKSFEPNDECNRVITTNVSFLNYIIEKVKMKCIEGVD